MDKRLHRLETFAARGSDGRTYSVHGFEHLARIDGVILGAEQWEPTGQVEFRLADGHVVHLRRDGEFEVPDSGLRLTRQ